jgi:cytochrome bd-type quinol oxidase subunit 1
MRITFGGARRPSLPLRLLVIGLLFCATGAYGVFDTVRDFLDGALMFNLSALALFIGIGLLRGRMAARTWARVSIVVVYVLCAVGVVVALVVALVGRAPPSFTLLGLDWDGQDALPAVLIAVVVVVVPLYLVQRLLYSAPVTTYLETRKAELDRAAALADDASLEA